jgi:hypothetical protein
MLQGRRDHGNVDMQVAIPNSLIPLPVPPQHPQFIHLAAGAELTEGTVHAPFDGVERDAFELGSRDDRRLRGQADRVDNAPGLAIWAGPQDRHETATTIDAPPCRVKQPVS